VGWFPTTSHYDFPISTSISNALTEYVNVFVSNKPLLMEFRVILRVTYCNWCLRSLARFSTWCSIGLVSNVPLKNVKSFFFKRSGWFFMFHSVVGDRNKCIRPAWTSSYGSGDPQVAQGCLFFLSRDFCAHTACVQRTTPAME